MSDELARDVDALMGMGLPCWLAQHVAAQQRQIRTDALVLKERYERLTQELAALRETVAQREADCEALRAERDALRPDAALGALVRRMPERSGLWRHRDRDGAQQWSEVGLDMDDDMCWATIETSPEVALGEGDDGS